MKIGILIYYLIKIDLYSCQLRHQHQYKGMKLMKKFVFLALALTLVVLLGFEISAIAEVIPAEY